eukprot:218646-Amphidinium_carterae.1
MSLALYSIIGGYESLPGWPSWNVGIGQIRAKHQSLCWNCSGIRVCSKAQPVGAVFSYENELSAITWGMRPTNFFQGALPDAVSSCLALVFFEAASTLIEGLAWPLLRKSSTPGNAGRGDMRMCSHQR